MTEGRPAIEIRVIELVKGAFKSREVLEAEHPDAAPLDDDQVMLQNWASTVHREGILLAHLAMVPKTRAELLTEMEGLVDRAPAWLDAHFQGRQVMTLDLFFQGIAQTLATQRAAFLRVVAEQASDPEAIEGKLTDAPVPVPTEERSALMRTVSNAITAHLEALVDLAYDFEVQAGWRSG